MDSPTCRIISWTDVNAGAPNFLENSQARASSRSTKAPISASGRELWSTCACLRAMLPQPINANRSLLIESPFHERLIHRDQLFALMFPAVPHEKLPRPTRLIASPSRIAVKAHNGVGQR